MKKIYNTPRLQFRQVKMTDIIITSDPQVTDDPSDGGTQLINDRSTGTDWDEYRN